MRNLKEKAIKLNREELKSVSGGKMEIPIDDPSDRMRCYCSGFSPVMNCSACKYCYVCSNKFNPYTM
jgi:hypothetical protein